MKIRIVLFLSFTLFFVSGVSSQSINDFTMDGMLGEEITYSEVKGEQLTLVDFWATWCAPCLKAIPKLAEIADKYRDDGVVVLGINVDGPRNLSKVKPVALSKGVNYPVVIDLNSDLMSELNVDKMPTLLLVNSEDEIIAYFEGYSAADALKIEEEIQKIIASE